MGGMTQRPWTPTKRRGPIAAEYTSPGPACVTLPPLIGMEHFSNPLRAFCHPYRSYILLKLNIREVKQEWTFF